MKSTTIIKKITNRSTSPKSQQQAKWFDNSKDWEIVLFGIMILSIVIIWYMNLVIAPYIVNGGGKNGHYRASYSSNARATSNDEVLRIDREVNGENEPNFHIVFSTGCNALQSWESYMFFYHIWRSGQKGNVTRIASGCSDKDAVIVQEQFRRVIQEGIPGGKERFHLHITPDYSTVHQGIITNKKQQEPYKFFNKPYGLKHWFDHKLGFNVTEATTDTTTNGRAIMKMPHDLQNTIIVVLDPDQIIIKPFQTDYTNDPYLRIYPDESKVDGKTSYRIRKGYPMSQIYLYGGYWIRNLGGPNLTNVLRAAADAPLTADKASTINDTNNGLLDWTSNVVDTHYSAGPPYIAMAEDMYNIVTIWSAIAVPVYDHTNDFLSEMMAYSTAAAYLKLPHTLVTSMTLSVPGLLHNEGWYRIHETTTEEFLTLAEPTYNTIDRPQLPEIFHFCQRYYMGPYFFSKYKVPKNILQCDQPLVLEPPSLVYKDPTTNQLYEVRNTSKSCGSIAFEYTHSVTCDGINNTIKSMEEAKHHAFFLCHILHKLNDAVLYWKQQNCQQPYNTNKTFVFSDFYREHIPVIERPPDTIS